MNDLIKQKLQVIIGFLADTYKGYADVCGEDDEINTIPAKNALKAAKEVKLILDIEEIGSGFDETFGAIGGMANGYRH